jgi:mannose/cellobiose epimerase-like protein (N-acyl-D-glucosamine 2-epimerase family)
VASLLDLGSPAGAAHVGWRQAEVGRLLDRAASARHPAGGFGRLDERGAVQLTAGRPLWVTCRMVHCLSLGHLLGRPGDAALVDEGLRALREEFADERYGGWFADADPDRRGEGRKEAYGHAFVVLAAASASVAGRPGARDLLADALDVVVSRLWDPAVGMPVDATDRTFTVPEPYRGANAAMHLVEALLAAADATGEAGWRARALSVAARLAGSAAAHGWRLPEHYDATWHELPDYNAERPRDPFRPYGATPGHALEWARLLLTLEASLAADAPSWLRHAAVALAARAVTDGWDTEVGGFVYTTSLRGEPVVAERFHWVACEAIGACWALATATGDPVWAERYEQYWAFTRTHLLDPEQPGLWRHELDAGNRPVARTWTDRPDVYHAVQACLLPSLPLAPGLAVALARC